MYCTVYKRAQNVTHIHCLLLVSFIIASNGMRIQTLQGITLQARKLRCKLSWRGQDPPRHFLAFFTTNGHVMAGGAAPPDPPTQIHFLVFSCSPFILTHT